MNRFLILLLIVFYSYAGYGQELITIEFDVNTFQICPDSFIVDSAIVRIDSTSNVCNVDNNFSYRGGFFISSSIAIDVSAIDNITSIEIDQVNACGASCSEIFITDQNGAVLFNVDEPPFNFSGDIEPVTFSNSNQSPIKEIVYESFEASILEVRITYSPISCRTRDSLALVALWEATHENGPWTNEWDLSMPMDSWWGVRLNSDGCIDCLDLDGEGECNWSINKGGNNLNGQIPSTIGDLMSLEGFFLNNNDLNGEIPIEIGNLISIQSIAIEGSNLTGTIPSTIGNLESLLELWLGANELNGNIPKEIGKLTNLKKIRLSGGNKLTGSIPIEFYNLTNLESINFEVNGLTGSILPDIQNFSNLKFLDLGGNDFTGEIPKEIGQLPLLESLSLSSNQLEGEIPSEIGDLNNLLTLSLAINNLEGNIPESFSNLENLKWLFLNSNKLTGEIPRWITELPLNKIWLKNNRFSSCFFENINDLCDLDFSISTSTNGYNFINNPALPWQGDFSRFCAGEEQIGAPCDDGDPNTENDIITEECGCVGAAIVVNECRERDSLALVALWEATHENGPWTNEWDLSMPMDTWFGVTLNEEGCIEKLELCEVCYSNSLDDIDNNLAGELPAEIGNLLSLTHLAIVKNSKLIGRLPIEIGNLTKLSQISFYNNNLDGEIPNSFYSLKNLESVDFYQNNFSGQLSNDIIALENLNSLSIFGNNFSGNLPNNIYQLTNLILLNIHSNNFSGTLSSEIRNLDNLVSLYASNNDFGGEIPNEIGEMINLQRLSLGANNFEGEIPNSIGNLVNLTQLWLSNNVLSGQIPKEIGNLSNLTQLFLSSNQLSGTIPPELGNLSNLANLRLNDNQLNGAIPKELGNLNNLTKFYIYNNQLENCFPETLNIYCDLDFSTLLGNDGYNFINNPALPWQGDFSRFCAGEDQIGAACDDGDPNTENDVITEECGCTGAAIMVNECRERDSLALVALWEATHENGPWTNEWDLGMPIDTWEGVTLNTDGCVIRLILFGNNLAGIIPSELGELSELIDLRLFINKLRGPIPSELSNLSKLTQLYLQDNQLSGNIPSELGSLTNLTRLWLHQNQLTGSIPTELSNIIDLKRLWLANNQLTGCFPDEIKNYCNLTFTTTVNADGYNFTNNPSLPWQGDFSRFCAGEDQIGAPCDDGDPNTQNDQINEDCECIGFDPCAVETNGVSNAGENTLYCENETIVLSANQPQNTTGQWTSPTGASILNPTEITTEITNLSEGENLLIWTLSTTECGAYDEDTVIISYALGVPQVQADSFTTFLERDFDASVIANDQLSEVAEWDLTVTTPPTKGTLTMNPNGSFNYNPNAEYCGTDYFEYEICNVLCPDFCDVARVDLNIILEEDNSIVAPNVITPNGDKYNEYFIIPQLYANPTNYPDNEFIVVNQWGDIVYERDNYQNDWNGVNNNGKELPQATYYYVFDFGDGREKIAGKVVILK